MILGKVIKNENNTRNAYEYQELNQDATIETNGYLEITKERKISELNL
jgi:hypothetical protein